VDSFTNFDLADRASIALDIAGPHGLNAKEVRKECSCGQRSSVKVLKHLVARGYARAVPTSKGTRYVFVRPYPPSDTALALARAA